MSLQLSELDKISNYGQTGEDQALHLERQFVPKKDDRDRLDMNKYLKGKFKQMFRGFSFKAWTSPNKWKNSIRMNRQL